MHDEHVGLAPQELDRLEDLWTDLAVRDGALVGRAVRGRELGGEEELVLGVVLAQEFARAFLVVVALGRVDVLEPGLDRYRAELARDLLRVLGWREEAEVSRERAG